MKYRVKQRRDEKNRDIYQVQASKNKFYICEIIARFEHFLSYKICSRKKSKDENKLPNQQKKLFAQFRGKI
jgi:hypothetical protein